MRHQLTTLAVFAGLLALPAAALAQSAGDDQYSDPLAPSQEPSGQPQQGSGTGQTVTPQGNGTAPTQSTPSASPQASASGSSLPRTGLNVVLLVAAGWWLLLGGAALRRVAHET